MFTIVGPNVPQRLDEYLTWFIPKDSPEYENIEAFLEEEFEDDIREGKDINLSTEVHYAWGFHLRVLPFSGFFGHVEKYVREEIAEQAIASLLQTMAAQKKKS